MAAVQKTQRPYHHGDLRAALIAAAEKELIEKGADAFSLRGAAKRAGVSHAAPAHHFRDTNALLDALAAAGFARLTAAMKQEQAEASPGKKDQLTAAGVGYVRFALENPELLQLMFGTSRRKGDDPDLAQHSEAAFSVLVNGVGAVRGRDAFKGDAGWRDVAACWSMVHGYAQLAIAGKMDFVTGLDFEQQRGVIEDLVRRALP
ncbi:MAG: TetR/AcrR family transcriptional regulator [Oricola sp.]